MVFGLLQVCFLVGTDDEVEEAREDPSESSQRSSKTSITSQESVDCQDEMTYSVGCQASAPPENRFTKHDKSLMR